MVSVQTIKEKLEKKLPGAQVEIQEQAHNPEHKQGKHVGVVITYAGFKGKTLLEQHKIVYRILEEELREDVHALALKTRIQ